MFLLLNPQNTDPTEDSMQARYVLSLIMLRESDSLYFIPPIR
jgi:hypothetical protein